MVLSDVAKAVPRPNTKHARPPNTTQDRSLSLPGAAHLTSAACALWSSEPHTNQQSCFANNRSQLFLPSWWRGALDLCVCVPFLRLSLGVPVGREI